MQHDTQSYQSTTSICTKYRHISLLCMYTHISPFPAHVYACIPILPSTQPYYKVCMCTFICKCVCDKYVWNHFWKENYERNHLIQSPTGEILFCCFCCTVTVLIVYQAHFHMWTHFILTLILWSRYYYYDFLFKRWANIISSPYLSLRCCSATLILHLLWYQLLGCLGHLLGPSLGKRPIQLRETAWT